MCGIIGWSGSNPRRFNKQKFDILGLFNNSRGGDSVGVSTDGEIYYGTGTAKNYDDFIVEGGYLPPFEIPVVIGHMRKASVGVVNENNAHPFGFGGEPEEKFKFIGCHNGTLSNYEDLGKKYEVETSIWKEDRRFERNKVDSEVLLEILYKTKNPDVLEEYIGGAALLFQDLNKPNKLYAFHGASKREVGDHLGLVEERPLYYYQESKDSVYISSIEEALIFIGGVKDENVFEFEHNILYEIKDGNVSKAIRVKIDRRGAGQRKSYGGFTTGGRGIASTINDYNLSHRKSKKRERTKTKRLKRLESVANIYDETVIEGDYLSAIYYNKLRYWRNGHLISGVFTFVRKYGFYKIGEVAADAQNKLYRFMGEYFSLETGDFVNDKLVDERIKSDATMFIPFEYGTKEMPVYFFHQGIMLESIYDFIALNGHKAFTFEQLSEMSKYPICKIGKHRLPNDKQNILYNGQKYTNNIIPLGSRNCYNIESGNLLSIDRYEDEVIKEAEKCCSLVDLPEDNCVIELPLKFEVPLVVTQQPVVHESGAKEIVGTVLTALEKPTKEFLDEDPPIDTYVEPGENDKVLDIINTHVMPIYEQMQICNENLKNESIDVVQEIVELNKEYLISVDCIIESKEKENG